MKKIFKIMACGLLFLTITGCGNETTPSDGNKNIVSFNEEGMNITVDDLYKELKTKYAINYLINRNEKKILNNEYEDSDDVNNYAENQIKLYKQIYYGNDENAFKEDLQNAGYSSIDEFKTYLKTNYKRTLAKNDYIKSNITKNEIEKYYNENVYGDVTVSHILVKVENSSNSTDEEKKESDNKAQEKIKEIYEKLDGGTSFAEVAKEYSEDTATSSNGGRIGTFNKGEMTTRFNEEFENAVLKLEVGKYTAKTVKSSYGYHIIYKDAQKEKPDLDTIKQTIIETLTTERGKEDTKAEYKAMIELREKYGLKFEDAELNTQYDNAVNNWLYSKDDTQ